MQLRTFSRQEGQGLVEYAFILVLIAVAVIIAVTQLGGRINQVFNLVVLQMQYPGVYSGDPVTIASLLPSAIRDTGGFHGSYGVTVTAPATLTEVPGGATVCVRFSLDGAGSQLSCGSPPSARFEGGETGSGRACVVAVESYNLSGGDVCADFSY